ncbi:hypothetical protein KF707_05400 [Candidatus Obscuribacterales bacterium]|jgi:hypothetical protein|nr:hypothetical protein [Candidatus Obscuribacterales bacterium]MBX3149237.1 hypothetical protein [Candidatus Obscuribacterales bacterium]
MPNAHEQLNKVDDSSSKPSAASDASFRALTEVYDDMRNKPSSSSNKPGASTDAVPETSKPDAGTLALPNLELIDMGPGKDGRILEPYFAGQSDVLATEDLTGKGGRILEPYYADQTEIFGSEDPMGKADRVPEPYFAPPTEGDVSKPNTDLRDEFFGEPDFENKSLEELQRDWQRLLATRPRGEKVLE